MALAVAFAALPSCGAYPYRPGAADAASPHARDPAIIATSPDDVAEDLFFRKLGWRGRCLPGVVVVNDAVGGPASAARVVARGRLEDATELEVATRTDHAGRFSLCIPGAEALALRRLELRVERDDLQTNTSSFVELDLRRAPPLSIFVARSPKR